MWWWAAALVWYIAWSLASFTLYGIDKWKATRQKRRFPEKLLLRLDLLGGWPGGRAGQMLFRHKRAKGAYMRKFWGVVALHVVLWVIVAWLVLR